VTYVLIHGGGSTGRFWDRLLAYLDRPAFPVDLPGRNGKPADFATLTVDEEAASVVADVGAAQLTDPLVVVAHSSGGLIVPAVVGALRERVAGIVLSAALIPAEGGCGIDCMKPRHREGLVASVEQSRRDGTTITLPGAPADPEPFRTAYGGDPLDDETLAYVVDPVRCVADTVNHYFQPVHWSTIVGTPVTYLLNTRDRPIPSPTQEQMVTHLSTAPKIVRLDTGHVPAVTEPERFARLLAEADVGD
jgi:pimeloyl-ACP methyl ester carboxylesterase